MPAGTGVALVGQRGAPPAPGRRWSARVERVGRVLRHEPEGAPAQRAEPPLGQREDLAAVELDAAASRARRSGSSRSSARAIVDLPEPDSPISARLSPRAEREAHVGDDLVRAVGDRQALDAQQRESAAATSAASAWSGHGGLLTVGRQGSWNGGTAGQSVLRSHRLILFTERTVAIVTQRGGVDQPRGQSGSPCPTR